MNTEQLLADRKKTHGKYEEHAAATQDTLRLWMGLPNWGNLSACQRETLHMIAHKVARVMTGDPNVKDHWDDIAGYSTLVSKDIDRLAALNRYANVAPIIQQQYIPGEHEKAMRKAQNAVNPVVPRREIEDADLHGLNDGA